MQGALRAAFEQHYLPLVRFCVLLSGQREVAEDIVQEVFVRAATKLEGLDSRDVHRYLRQVALNLWRNRLRRLALERRYLLTRRRVPSGTADAIEERDALWRALMRLPARQRACLVLRYYEDLPEQEVAQLLRCSVGTVKSHTHRALTRLRRELGDEH